MNPKSKTLTCYEHDYLKEGHKAEGNQVEFRESHRALLETFHGRGFKHAFDLQHKGVKFKQFVGVLQVKDLTIEVLPKIDRQSDTNQDKAPIYRKILLQMLNESGLLDVRDSEQSRLSLYKHSILDIYFELFVRECESIIRYGLLKKYRKKTGNLYALKGALQFNKHIRDNLIHKERFHTRHTIYDPMNPWNQVLYKTLLVLSHMNTNPMLKNRINNLLLQFPEMPDIKVSDTFFNRLTYNRKTERYRQAMQIARLILLNYHPDVMRGPNEVLALMFDMDKLWEKWVLRKLQKELNPKGYHVQGQKSEKFWNSETQGQQNKHLQPDIIIDYPKDDNRRIVIDTKWKTPAKKDGPSGDDLRQLYAYQKYFGAKEGILLYPSNTDQTYGGQFEGINLNCHQVFRQIIKNGKAELNGEDLV